MKNYNLYVGIDVSKGKADAAILQVSELRSVKPKFLRKKLSFRFVKSEVKSFLETVRKYSDNSKCNHTYFALEVTGIYSSNIYNFIKENCNDDEEIHQLNTDFVNRWRESHNISKSDPLDAQTISTIGGTDDDVRYVSDNVFENKKERLPYTEKNSGTAAFVLRIRAYWESVHRCEGNRFRRT